MRRLGKEVGGRMEGRADPELVKMAVEDAMEGRRSRW